MSLLLQRGDPFPQQDILLAQILVLLIQIRNGRLQRRNVLLLLLARQARRFTILDHPLLPFQRLHLSGHNPFSQVWSIFSPLQQYHNTCVGKSVSPLSAKKKKNLPVRLPSKKIRHPKKGREDKKEISSDYLENGIPSI